VTVTGLVVSTAQCYMSLDHATNALFDPALNDALDSAEWYWWTSTILDGISLAGAFAAAGATIQFVIRLQRASGRPFREVLRSLDRATRRRLAEDVARYKGEAPTRRQCIRLVREGKISDKIFRVEQVTRAMQKQLHEAIGAALSVTSSATSGVLRQLAVGVFQEE
jgi:hypothetical protein